MRLRMASTLQLTTEPDCFTSLTKTETSLCSAPVDLEQRKRATGPRLHQSLTGTAPSPRGRLIVVWYLRLALNAAPAS